MERFKIEFDGKSYDADRVDEEIFGLHLKTLSSMVVRKSWGNTRMICFIFFFVDFNIS